MTPDLSGFPTPTRTACMKCDAALHGDVSGEHCWCPTCRYLLRRPEPPYPRYRTTLPPQSVLVALGLGDSFDERQRRELVPSGRRVESWYDPDEPEYDPAEKFDRIFNRVPGFTA